MKEEIDQRYGVSQLCLGLPCQSCRIWSFEFCCLPLVLQGAFTLQLCDTEFVMANGVLVCYHTFGNLPPPCILFCAGGAPINSFLKFGYDSSSLAHRLAIFA